ncbi:hypothetical protein F4679DRAFT_587607 [Xylaria curta]|nr:hypothetical protein F4679DRAFT_587607 [Xylaria curta]
MPSFSEPDTDMAFSGTLSHLHDEDTSQSEDIETPSTSVSDFEETRSLPDTCDDTDDAASESETPTPRNEMPSDSYITIKSTTKISSSSSTSMSRSQSASSLYTQVLHEYVRYNHKTLVKGGIYNFNAILINQAFGFDAATAQLLGIPLNAFTVTLCFLVGYLATKTGHTIYCIIASLFVCLIGIVVLITVAPNEPTYRGLLVAFYFMQCIQAINPSCYSLLSLVTWAGGNATGLQLFQSKWAPRYFNTLCIHIGL